MPRHRTKETHAILKFKQWLSLLAHSPDVEKNTDGVIRWEQAVKEQQPSAYVRLEARERRLLTVAGRVMLKKYVDEVEKSKRRHKLGTRARQEGLERFIYYFTRYLIPVLERSSPQLFKVAVEYALNSVVVEYSAYVGPPEFFFKAESTFEILKRARDLRLNVPSELYSKCEAAMAPRRLTVQEFVLGFPVDWDQQLVKCMEDVFGDRTFGDVSLYDALMMTISKLPEHRLSGYLSHSIDKGELSVSGDKLLSIASHRKWILQPSGQPSPLYFLLKWYFSAVRNLPHHKFASYTSSEVRDALLVTNYILKQIDDFATGSGR